ncbi:hypothetical protein VPH35_081452 [Triticum aestivum]|uniref:Uncharacterized protein n=1 Tax=Triticum urartu TaxID=4572 RepID=A0A8R7QCK0_TRIUA
MWARIPSRKLARLSSARCQELLQGLLPLPSCGPRMSAPMPVGRPRRCSWHSDKAQLPVPRTISSAWWDVTSMPRRPFPGREQQRQRSSPILDQASAATVQHRCWCRPATRHRWNPTAA